MEAIGLNPIRFDRIGLDPIRVNAIKLGVPGAASGSDRPYIDPEVLASLVAVCICDGKSNDDPDRAVIKNLVDPDNPFVISNAAYEGMSGHNGYPVVFGANKTWKQLPTYNSIYSINDNKIHITKVLGANRGLIFSYVKQNDQLSDITEIPSFKIKVSGLKGDSKLRYSYIKTENAVYQTLLDLDNGIHKLPKSLRPTDSIVNESWIGFTITPIVENEITFDCDITIEVLPEYEGAFVTDGKDDLITSTKTVKEMLGGSNEVTVVSMVHQIGLSSLTTINNIRSESVAHVVCRNICSFAGKTGIYGYSRQINTNNPPALINNILGDKKDYTAEGNSALDPTDKFFVQGYKYSGTISEVSPIAYYWTFIANKVLTTDQINQVISYFNLDKHVKPDVYYDIKKQGLSNDTPEADWYLKDFSGNGHDMQLYNFAKTPESGINEDGGLQSDGVNDYGKAERLPIFKDYTVVADRALIGDGQGAFMTKSSEIQMGAFGLEIATGEQMSFGNSLHTSIVNKDRSITYMSTYSYNGQPNTKGTREDGSYLCLATIKPGDFRFSSVALWSLLLFPYSLSEFLLERQLKRYKLGTLYPGMIEWRPKVNINVPVVTPPTFSMNNGSDIITNGQYIPEGTEITIRIFTTTDSSVGGINEATAKINGVDIELSPSGNKTYYGGKFIVSSKQKIDITIDEYIRYEDIVQPYPAIINLKQDGKTITWGDKLKVGSDIVFVGSANLLPELYTVSDTRYNGVTLYPNTIIKVEKSMVFDNARTYLKANEPNCILSPNRLRIPNSSYKILGYIPDLTGKGNHGKLNNFAYTEDSGVSVDGSIKFDSTDDHITIPNIIGGKCVMAKVKINIVSGVIYDQRRANVLNKSWVQLNPNQIAFEQNAVSTYIDGILNHNVTCSDLVSKTVNITCELEIGDTSGTYQPTIGSTYAVGYTTNINLYEFMLFPDVPDEEEIKKLNDVMGIEGGYVESPNYYWDSFGKSNINKEDIDYDNLRQGRDANRQLIDKSVLGLKAIENYIKTGNGSDIVSRRLYLNNVAYNSESGYTDNNGLLLDGVDDHAVNTVIPAVTDFTVIAKREWINKDTIGNECFIHKGVINTPIGETAFMLEYEIANDTYYRSSSYGGYINIERTNRPEKIIYQTPTSYNGTAITKGSGTDTIGLTLGAVTNNYWHGVFYKLMFYTKTIDQLSINMLKNLFERDELIDVTNPIFKKEELTKIGF